MDSIDITVFTTRPDTLFGVTGLVVAPEHKLVKNIISKDIKVDAKYYNNVKKYVEESSKKLDLQRTDLNKEKTGVFTGLYVVNPVNNEKIPVWIADYVLGYYGHGAVMVVPAHDKRDFEFAKKYGLEMKPVITAEKEENKQDEYYTGVGYVIPSESAKTFLNNVNYFDKSVLSTNFKSDVIKEMEKIGFGKKVVEYKLRDWVFSRQRYWGEPIPMVFCENCAKKNVVAGGIEDKSMAGWFPIPEEQLPLKLPYVKSYEVPDTGESPLAQMDSFVKTTCPNCGGEARRETDTMPNWAGSCWYFLRFADPQNSKEPWGGDKIKIWEPVDWYIGGAEHAVLHLLYSRFWIKALQDLGLVPFSEPFLRLRNVGMVLAEDHRKMSKSWGNVINPDDVVAEYGADALRLYEMFMAPFNQENAWSTAALQGTHRFLSRIWNLASISNKTEVSDKQLVQNLYKTVQKVTKDIQETKFNTAVSTMMEFLNYWEKSKEGLSAKEIKMFLQILAPFAPFTTEELWRGVFGEKNSIHRSSWPEIDESKLKEVDIRIPVQINGKVRSVITVKPVEIDEETVVEKAKKEKNIKIYLLGKEYKLIYVKGKVLNFVV